MTKREKARNQTKRKVDIVLESIFIIVSDKITHKEKEREVVNQIQNEPIATTHFLYYPSVWETLRTILISWQTQEELRAFTLQFMCCPKFDFPIDSQNLYKLMQDEFRKLVFLRKQVLTLLATHKHSQ